MSPFFNPTIKVVTFHLHGWCVLGVFLLPAFTRLGHECQDLLSPCDEMHVCTDYTSVYTLIRKGFGGNGVWYNLNDMRVCLSSSVYSKKNCWNLNVPIRIQRFSVQSLQEGNLELEILTNNSRMLRVNIDVWSQIYFNSKLSWNIIIEYKQKKM